MKLDLMLVHQMQLAASGIVRKTLCQSEANAFIQLEMCNPWPTVSEHLLIFFILCLTKIPTAVSMCLAYIDLLLNNALPPS